MLLKSRQIQHTFPHKMALNLASPYQVCEGGKHVHGEQSLNAVRGICQVQTGKKGDGRLNANYFLPRPLREFSSSSQMRESAIREHKTLG